MSAYPAPPDIIDGRVAWVFGDDFDIDLVVGVSNIKSYDPDHLRSVCMTAYDPGFVDRVRPGDIIVGDGDGVVVIPKDLADEVARDGVEQEGIEVFIKLQVEKGRSTIGLYPPDDTVRAEYADWLAAGKPC